MLGADYLGVSLLLATWPWTQGSSVRHQTPSQALIVDPVRDEMTAGAMIGRTPALFKPVAYVRNHELAPTLEDLTP